MYGMCLLKGGVGEQHITQGHNQLSRARVADNVQEIRQIGYDDLFSAACRVQIVERIHILLEPRLRDSERIPYTSSMQNDTARFLPNETCRHLQLVVCPHLPRAPTIPSLVRIVRRRQMHNLNACAL